MSTPATGQTPAPTAAELEAEIAERRAHLSTTIDELVTRVSPKEIARREVESVRIRIAEATRTPDGQIRSELIVAALGATAAVLIIAGLVRRNRG